MWTADLVRSLPVAAFAAAVAERSPADLLGRVSSAFRTLAAAGAPLGALLGGAVATVRGLNTPALLAAVFFALSVTALIPALNPDVSVVHPDDGVRTARVKP